ncbi:MAG: hypothetical protein LUD15_01255 [Bacteroides sp.]|nr:hypothetical protein [Bacteroides sp.]
MELAEPIVVLNELRADLMDITYNSSRDIQEINLGTPSSGNKYTDITPFYSVIQNCNDMLYNFKIMKDENRLTEDEYKERYSDVVGLRSWVYFQLGIQFGEVIYLTEPVISVEDVLKTQGQRTIDFDTLLDELIACVEDSQVSLDNYANSSLIEYYLDGYELSFFFVKKQLLLADLYLWRGDYLKAATLYRKVLATNEDQEATLNHLSYKLNCAVWYSNSTPYF